MEQIAIFESEMTAQKREAVELHFEIKKNGDLAAGYLCEFAASLKKMRDKRRYTELDFESFDDYVEQAVGIRKRQAYNYIQALEALFTEITERRRPVGALPIDTTDCLYVPVAVEGDSIGIIYEAGEGEICLVRYGHPEGLL